MSDDWYSITDLPVGSVSDAEVAWNGRVFRAHYLLNSKIKRMQWCEYRNGEICWLPPKKEAVEWGLHPQRWRPMNPKWTWPNGIVPEPLPVRIVPRMVYSRQSFDSVSDAEIAAERADMRHEAEARARSGEPGEARDVPWWRDSTRIRYLPAGEVTREMAEGRVMRALAHAGPSFERFKVHFRTTASWLEAISDERAAVEREAERIDLGKLPRLPSFPSDGRDFLEAMRWFTALGRPGARLSRRQRILIAKSGDRVATWSEIGIVLGLKRQRVEQLYDSAIDACHRVANGGHAFKQETDQIEAVRERNRAHKRRA